MKIEYVDRGDGKNFALDITLPTNGASGMDPIAVTDFENPRLIGFNALGSVPGADIDVVFNGTVDIDSSEVLGYHDETFSPGGVDNCICQWEFRGMSEAK